MGCTSSGQSSIKRYPSFLHLALTGEAGLLLLAWALGRWLDLSPFDRFHLTLTGVLWGLVATVPLLLGLAWMVTSQIAPVRGLVNMVIEQLGHLLAQLSILELALLAAVAGLSEEILFRGVLQDRLARFLPDSLALLGASLVFGLVHFVNRAYAALAGVMGLYLGGLFWIQGNLLAPVLAHGLYDFAALLYVARHGAARDHGDPAMHNSRDTHQ